MAYCAKRQPLCQLMFLCLKAGLKIQGSSTSTMKYSCGVMVSASGSDPEDCGFKSYREYPDASIAQQAERLPCKEMVVGSIPT